MELREGSWKRIGRGEVEFGRQIGGGGAGVVYQGWHNGKEVALKALFDPRVNEQLAREFVDELVSMSKLKHRNIVSFLGACVEPTNMFFVMELCETSLYDVIHIEQRSLSLQACLHIALDIASAMEYLHRLQPCIVHRDLKTQNVLLAQNGVAKLCDFGLVRSTNIAAGTPAYMAPELLLNRSCSRFVDVYSFGILLWEMLARKLPFFGFELDDIKMHVCRGERPPLASQNIPAGLEQLIRSCWDGDANARPEFSNVLDQLWAISASLPKETATEMLEGKEADALDMLLGL